MSARERQFRLTSPVVSETELHEAVARMLAYCVAPPATWAAYPAGHIPLDARWAAKLYRCGLKRGWPDLMVAHERRWYGIELKREGGALSRDRLVRTRRGGVRLLEGQRSIFPVLLVAAFHDIRICRSLDEARAALRDWGIPSRLGDAA